MHTGFQQQQPLLVSAAVRSAPSPQHGAHLDIRSVATDAPSDAPRAPDEDRTFAAPPNRAEP